MTVSTKATPLVTAAVIVAAAVFACYLNTLQAGFVYDDPFLITENPLVVNDGVSAADIFREEFFGGGRGASGFYRPLMILLYRFELQAFGPEPALFHMVNVITHVGAVLVLLLLLVRLRLSMPAAAAGALFFGLHPLNCESVAWISGGANATVFLLMGGALLFFLRFLDGGEEKGWRSPDLWLSCMLFLPALLAKESALILPLVALLLLTCRGAEGRGEQRERRGRLRYFLPFLLLAAAYVAVHSLATDGAKGELLYYGRGDFSERLATFFAVVPRYVHFLIFPGTLNIARPIFLSPGFFDVWSVAGLVILLFLAALTIRAWWKGDRPVLIGAGLILFTLLSVSTVIPFAYNFREMHFPFFESYMYVATAGLGCLFAVAGGRLLNRARGFSARLPRRSTAAVLFAITLVWLGSFGVTAHRRNNDWNNDLRLFRKAACLFPLSPTLSLNLGEALLKRGDFERAAKIFHHAWTLAPGETMPRVNEAIARLRAGELKEAEDIVRELIEKDPDNCQACDTLGMIRIERGDIEGALPLFGKAFRLSEGAPSFGNNLAHLLVELRVLAEKIFLAKEYDRALDLADRVIAEVPATAWAHEVRGVILDDRGEEEEAARSLSAAVRLSPDSLFAATRLLRILRKHGMEAEALEIEMYIEAGRKRIPEKMRREEGGG